MHTYANPRSSTRYTLVNRCKDTLSYRLRIRFACIKYLALDNVPKHTMSRLSYREIFCVFNFLDIP